ncbi:hypothetical protein C8A03DRAFT_35207 [Achaetomium macrosporum]|uniref:Uncharacterized protein n=1 Tax=Achaetomium macrosporum TaxID=79813 RepID=A0AAN7C7X0_9PEZI|nr:hypothetical protein C8A03DRAFT_35207 [Achaetomium macrosporum]
MTSPTNIGEKKEDPRIGFSSRVNDLVMMIKGASGSIGSSPALHFPQYISQDEDFACSGRALCPRFESNAPPQTVHSWSPQERFVSDHSDDEDDLPIPHIPDLPLYDVFNPAVNPAAAFCSVDLTLSHPMSLFCHHSRTRAIGRALLVPARFLAAVGMLYPDAEFAVSRYPLVDP